MNSLREGKNDVVEVDEERASRQPPSEDSHNIARWERFPALVRLRLAGKWQTGAGSRRSSARAAHAPIMSFMPVCEEAILTRPRERSPANRSW